MTNGLLLRRAFPRTVRHMIVELPVTGERIEGQFMPHDDPSVPLCVKLGKSGHVIYALTAMLKNGFRIVECTPAERAIVASHGIALAE